MRVHAALLPVVSPDADREVWSRFVEPLAESVREALDERTSARWIIEIEEPARLPDDDPRSPSDFLDQATLRMAEAGYDLVIVLTNVALVSRRTRVEPILTSPISRIGALSTRGLTGTRSGQATRSLDGPEVVEDARGLVLEVVRRLFETDDLASAADRFPEEELRRAGPIEGLVFHLRSAFSHASLVARTLGRNRAPLMALSLPTLSTAAVAPALILVFSAETWDVGFGMESWTAAAFAALSVVAATIYLARVQDLFFPRRERRVVNEHLAVVNVTVLLTLLLMMIGLFLLVGGLMLGIQILIFPSRLMETWPTLAVETIGASDHVRLACFISTVAVTTGALGGGLESRTVLRHLALFRSNS
ncbi:MAG: hypothetical protein R3326_07055 [Gemmatimonadota bacterium]|nr:hypothetical protein [Gemmatimonadota bacterium]